MNNRSRFVLGTVQFGLDYGINSAGRPDTDEVRKILKLCLQSGVRYLDTAHAYGTSEEVLGQSWPDDASNAFRIVTKVPPGTSPSSFDQKIEVSLDRLNENGVYGVLFHRLVDFQADPKRFEERMIRAKAAGKVRCFGYSLYQPEEAEWLLEHASIVDLVQVPYSILDTRFSEVISKLKAKYNTEIHVRSVFLQGLYFKQPADLTEKLKPLAPYITQLIELSGLLSCNLNELLLSYVFQNKQIDGVLTGVDNAEQLRLNLEAINNLKTGLPDITIPEKLYPLLNPANWK